MAGVFSGFRKRRDAAPDSFEEDASLGMEDGHEKADEALLIDELLIPDPAESASRALVPAGPGNFYQTAIALVHIERLHTNRRQPRRKVDDAAIQELAQSIRTRGLLQPILVRNHPDFSGDFEIVAGELRWLAAELAGLGEVPVVIRDVTDGQMLECSLIENLHRQDLQPLELAEGYRHLIEEYQHSQESLAHILGKSRSHVANTLRLLNLTPEVKDLLGAGKITAGHARAVMGSGAPEKLAEQIVTAKLSVRDAEALAQQEALRETGKMAAEDRPPRKTGWQAGPAIEPELSELLGHKVTLSQGSRGSTLTIHFPDDAACDATLAQLKRLLKAQAAAEGKPALKLVDGSTEAAEASAQGQKALIAELEKRYAKDDTSRG